MSPVCPNCESVRAVHPPPHRLVQVAKSQRTPPWTAPEYPLAQNVSLCLALQTWRSKHPGCLWMWVAPHRCLRKKRSWVLLGRVDSWWESFKPPKWPELSVFFTSHHRITSSPWLGWQLHKFFKYQNVLPKKIHKTQKRTLKMYLRKFTENQSLQAVKNPISEPRSWICSRRKASPCCESKTVVPMENYSPYKCHIVYLCLLGVDIRGLQSLDCETCFRRVIKCLFVGALQCSDADLTETKRTKNIKKTFIDLTICQGQFIDWTEQVSIIKILENPSNHPLGGIPPQPKRLEIVVLFLFTSNSPTDLLLSPGLTQNLCCFNDWHFNVADVIPFLQKLVAWFLTSHTFSGAVF